MLRIYDKDSAPGGKIVGNLRVEDVEESCGSSDVDEAGGGVVMVGVELDGTVESENPIEVGSTEEPRGLSDVDVSGAPVGVGFDCTVDSEDPIEVGSTEESCGCSDVDGPGKEVVVVVVVIFSQSSL